MCEAESQFLKKNLQVVSEHVGFHEPLLRLFGDTGKEEDDNTPGDFVLNLIPDEALYESLGRLRGDFPSKRKRAVKLLWDANDERRDRRAAAFVGRSCSNAEGCC